MKKLDQIMELIAIVVMGFAVLILSIVTSLQVVARFVFSNPIAWGQDIIRLCFVYLVFFGGAYCVSKNEHLNVDILLASLPKKYRYFLILWIEIIVLFFFIFLLYYGFIFMKTGLHQKAPYLPLSMSIYYFSLPSASLMMLYFQMRKIVCFIKGGERTC